MPHIQQAFKLARRYCAQAAGIAVLAATKGMAAIGLKGTHEAAGDSRFEITQAVFPDESSAPRRPMPGA